MKALARQLRRHWDDILAYFDHRRTNAVLEGLNSIIQNVKTRCVCSIESGPCERVESLQMSGRF